MTTNNDEVSWTKIAWDKRAQVHRSQNGRDVTYAVPFEGSAHHALLNAAVGQIETADVRHWSGPRGKIIYVTTSERSN